MSEFLAEARVLIRPDTTKFRAELEAALASATSKPVVVPVQAQLVSAGAAITENTAQINANTAAVTQNAAAIESDAAARTRLAAISRATATQQALAATAAEKFAFAQQAVVGASSEVAAAQVTLTRSLAAVGAAERELAGALAAKNRLYIEAARASLAVSRAYATEAEAALLAARAEAAHARSLGAVSTAGIASSASLLGLRGAVLTAGAAFLGATVAFQTVQKSIKEASDTAEEFSKVGVVFGDSAKQVQDFARTTASSLGISNVEALRAAGIFGNLFRSISIVPEAAAAMSVELVQLSADLASFNNADPSQVLENIRSGLAGEPEPLRKFGIFLSQARAQQEALIETGKKSVKQLTQGEIVQARYNIILRDGAIAQGDVARTADSLANQIRFLRAETSDLSAEFGSALVPALKLAVTGAREYVEVAQTAANATKFFAGAVKGLVGIIPGADSKVAGFAKTMARFGARSVALGGPTLALVSFGIEKIAGSSDKAAEKLPRLSDALDAGARAAQIAAFAIVAASRAIGDLSGSLDALEVSRLKIQTGLQAGGRDAEIANLKAQIATDKAVIAETKSGTKARRDALLALKQDQDDLAALEKDIASEATDAANARKTAAEEAARARAEADQALLDLFGQRREDQDRRIARASDTAGLQDDIRAQNNLQALIKQQIAKIRARVRDEQARKEAIRELRQALIDSRREEEALRQEQQKAAQEKAKERQERAADILDIKIQIAETKGQVALERRLLEEKKRSLLRRIKAAKGDQLLIAQLRLELAQTEKELNDLNKQQEKTGKTLGQSQFEFLQSLQGFSANLLGNLIPGFATSGLVGGSTPAAGQGIADLGAGPQDRINQAAAVGAARDRGVRPVQVDTTNAILRQILRTLQGRPQQPPEIAYNRAHGGASFDTL